MERESSSIFNFKQFVLRFGLPFIVAAAIFCMLYNCVLEIKIILQSPGAGAYKIYRMIHEVHMDEVPILGSSRCAGMYVPELISSRCYNYGIENTEFDLIYLLLQHELKKPKTTPIIINFDYELYRVKMGDIAHYIFNANEPDIRKYMGDEYRVTYSIPGIRYFGHLDHYIKLYIADHTTKNVSSKGGFFLINKFSQTSFDKQIIRRLNTPVDWQPDTVKQNLFRAMVASHPQRKFILIGAPYHSSYYKAFTNMPEANKYIQSLSDLKNFFFLDYSSHQYPDSLFLNTTHLNYAGAKRFSAEIKEQMKRIDPIFN